MSQNRQISDIFHNCPEQQQQSNPKDLGSKFPWSKSNLVKTDNYPAIHGYFLKLEGQNQRVLIPKHDQS